MAQHDAVTRRGTLLSGAGRIPKQRRCQNGREEHQLPEENHGFPREVGCYVMFLWSFLLYSAEKRKSLSCEASLFIFLYKVHCFYHVFFGQNQGFANGFGARQGLEADVSIWLKNALLLWDMCLLKWISRWTNDKCVHSMMKERYLEDARSSTSMYIYICYAHTHIYTYIYIYFKIAPPTRSKRNTSLF